MADLDPSHAWVLIHVPIIEHVLLRDFVPWAWRCRMKEQITENSPVFLGSNCTSKALLGSDLDRFLLVLIPKIARHIVLGIDVVAVDLWCGFILDYRLSPGWLGLDRSQIAIRFHRFTLCDD